MGFKGGNVLEPGCGTGLFLAALPDDLRVWTSFTAIKNDPVTARIAGRFELAIDNPPFSDRTVRADDPAGKLGLVQHGYVIAGRLSASIRVVSRPS